MNRAQLETTARIKREDLTGLLDTMTPMESQPITARASIADIEAELARQCALPVAEEPAPTPPVPARAARKTAKVAKRVAKAAAKAEASTKAAAAKEDLIAKAEAAALAEEAVKVAAAARSETAAAAADEGDGACAAPVISEQTRRYGDETTRASVEATLAAVEATRAAVEATRCAIEASLAAAAPARNVEATTGAGSGRSTVETASSIIDAASDGVPRLFNDVDWDELLGAAVSAMVTPKIVALPPPVPTTATKPRPKRASAAPFSHIASLLPACTPNRAPRATRPPLLARATTQNGTLVAEDKAAQLVADVRARLASEAERCVQPDSGRVAFPLLSAQVASQLSGEEIAMLPMEVRLALPEVANWSTPPRIQMTPVPGITIRVSGIDGQVDSDDHETLDRSRRIMTIGASFAATIAVAVSALYFLI